MILPELHIDTTVKTIPMRVAEAQHALLLGKQSKGMSGDPLATTWEVIQAVHGQLSFSFPGGLTEFEADVRSVPLAPGSEARYYLSEGENRLFSLDKDGNSAWHISVNLHIVALRKSLVVTADAGSPIFAFAIRLAVNDVYRLVYFHDGNHEDHNDGGHTQTIAGLTEHVRKLRFCCRFQAGPFAARGAGGRNQQMQNDAFAFIEGELMA